jgi:stage II sporulation protein R
VVPKESKEKLKNVLTQEEYDAVFSKEKPDIRIRLKIVDLIKDYLAKES